MAEQRGPKRWTQCHRRCRERILYSPNTIEYQSDTGTQFDAESGTILGGFNAYYPTAIGAQAGYFLTGSTIQGGTLGCHGSLKQRDSVDLCR